MARTQYSAQFKTKLVLEVLGGEKELGAIAYENGISTVFEDPKKAEKQPKRKEESLKNETERMLKTIGQLTLERDFLQGCFRQCGLPIPELGQEQ